MAIDIPEDVVNIVLHEYVMSKHIPGAFIVKTPSKEDIKIIINGFISWALKSGRIDSNMLIDISGWDIKDTVVQ